LIRALLLVALVALLGGAADAAPVLVSLPDGTYRAATPPNWDGRRKLPLVLYLHGYREDSAKVMARTDLVAAVTHLGMLFIAPDGVDGGWSHIGAPRARRDDIAFLHAVVADAERRWPIDRARVFAAGFSIGGSMVWDLACHGAQGFAAFLPFSGDFWTPYPTRCISGAFDLRHTHAVNDHTFPMAGRALIQGRFHQGNLDQGLAILRAADGCGTEPDRVTQEGELRCESWTRCSSGKELELCLHHADHEIKPQWLERSVEWAMQRVAAKG
jgi:polyhydroxybutyrate depolymerase